MMCRAYREQQPDRTGRDKRARAVRRFSAPIHQSTGSPQRGRTSLASLALRQVGFVELRDHRGGCITSPFVIDMCFIGRPKGSRPAARPFARAGDGPHYFIWAPASSYSGVAVGAVNGAVPRSTHGTDAGQPDAFVIPRRAAGLASTVSPARAVPSISWRRRWW